MMIRVIAQLMAAAFFSQILHASGNAKTATLSDHDISSTFITDDDAGQ